MADQEIIVLSQHQKIRAQSGYVRQPSNDMTSDGPSREEIDAKMAKIGAETDTKIARLEGKLDLVLAKLDYVLKDNTETRDSIRSEAQSSRATSWTVGIGLLAVIIAALALFPAIFDMGSKNQENMDRSVSAYFAAHTLPNQPPAKPH